MYRIKEVASIVNSKNIKTLLDVGCRDCILRKYLNEEIVYAGNDLFQNNEGSVRFVGDINKISFSETFDCVTAIDILEHVEDPYSLFDKLLSIGNKYLVINLPNCYDLKSKIKFVFKGDLGEKYKFGVENSLDRHRWLMSYRDIINFYSHKAKVNDCKLELFPNQYGDKSNRLTSKFGLILRAILPKDLTSESIIGVFEKQI